jgi:hypothetical protein
MKALFVLMNHRLSVEQEADAKQSLGVEEVIYPPESVLEVWGNVPASASMWDLKEYLGPVCKWLKSVCEANDIVLVQGESVASYLIVTGLREAYPLDNIRCVAATSCRDVIEEKQEDGSVIKKSVFRHVRYRAYYA